MELDNHKNLKLEIASFFGRPRMLFESMNTPGVGHQRVFDFIKQLHETIENYRVKFVTMSTTSDNVVASDKKAGK